VRPVIAAIISKNALLRSRIETALEGSADVESVLIIPEYPDVSKIRSLEDTHEKYVAFIDFGDNTERALDLAAEISRFCPSVGAVAVNAGSAPDDLIAIVRAGIHEILPQSFSDLDAATAILNVARKLSHFAGPSVINGTVHAFLPAKPGAGASSLAVYSALACARNADHRPILLDFDVHLGITSFVLKLDSSTSIIDAFENAGRMEAALWDQIISERDGLDVLGSAPAEFGAEVPLQSFLSVLKWARREYTTVVVDLPGTMEDFEIATMQQAGTIFLVCGPDLVGIHMARRKIQRLRSLQLIDHVCVVMNRVDKRTGLSVRDLEGLLGLPIRISLPVDEDSINQAVQKGTCVSPKSALGKQIEAMALKMAGASKAKNAGAPRPRRKFVEFFSIPQARGLDPWRS
jgi:pilus assembly protein CpaE